MKNNRIFNIAVDTGHFVKGDILKMNGNVSAIVLYECKNTRTRKVLHWVGAKTKLFKVKLYNPFYNTYKLKIINNE